MAGLSLDIDTSEAHKRLDELDARAHARDASLESAVDAAVDRRSAARDADIDAAVDRRFAQLLDQLAVIANAG